MNLRIKGILCIISAAFCFALMGLLIRLAGDVPTFQKCFFRNIVACFVVITMLIKDKKSIRIHSGDLKFLLMRAGFGTIGLICNFYAIDHMVLSDASMLNKLSPFFVIIFSFIILREKLTLVQAISVVVAFIGALFIIKPTSDMGNFPALIGAIGGAGAGLAYTMVRILGKRKVDGKVVILFFSAFSCIVCIPLMIGNFRMMTPWQFVSLLGAGIAATGGQFSITKAYFYAPAKEISVYDYTQIVFSALLGVIILGQVPDRFSILGYMIICTTAILMYLYNKKNDQRIHNRKKTA
jgi:drug/metabolite transporter (DMT)-like permease